MNKNLLQELADVNRIFRLQSERIERVLSGENKSVVYPKKVYLRLIVNNVAV